MRKFDSLNLHVIVFTVLRVVFNTSYRMVYPFLAVFARGLGVDVTMLSYALTLRSATGLLGVILAPVADSHGRRVSMALGLLLFSFGSALVFIWPSFPMLVLALILTNLGMQIFIPAMQAYLGDRIPFQRLGRAIGVTEASWALSFMLGIPAMAWLIDRGGWSAPFPALAGLGILGLILLLVMVPSDRPEAGQPRQKLWMALKVAFSNPIAWVALVFCLTSTVANEVVNLMFGVWMEDSFGLQLAALGAASVVIGLSELAGSSLTAWLVDRLGKRRSVAIGLATNALSAVLLVLLGGSLVGALVALFLFYLTFEFTIVSSLPLMSEISPAARATMMALVIGFFSAGRALGDLLGPWLYTFGFWGNVAACVVLNLISLALLARIRVGEEGQ